MRHGFPLLLAALVSAAALAAPPVGNNLSVQGTELAPDAIGGPGHPPRPMMDPARGEAMWALHAKSLHDKLKLKPEQEPAWNAFSGAMKPDGKMMDQQEGTAPERMERHVQQMQQRLQALKTFYAQLTPEQRQVLDRMHDEHMGMMHKKMPQGGKP